MKKLLPIMGAMIAVLVAMAFAIGPGQAFAESRDHDTRTISSSEYQRSHGSRYSHDRQTSETDNRHSQDDGRTSTAPAPTPTPTQGDEYDDDHEGTSTSPTPTPTPTPTPGPTPTPTLVSYSATIQPILDKECNSCHPTAGVNLSSYTGTKSVVNLLPGMGSSHLTSSELQALMDWISQGALNN